MVKKKKSNLDEFDGYMLSNFKSALKSVKELKNYFFFILILFFLVGIFGFFFPGFFEKQILELIADLIEKTEGMSSFELISFIVSNNVQSSFFGLFLGVFFGIAPIIVTVVNGYVLGFVANKTVAIEGFAILWRLLPHGIFELPAIILSLAVGLKLGMFLFISKNKSLKELWKWIKDAIRVFVFIILPLLAIAGIIEGILIVLLG